ncbi:MAG: hypothetical protein JNG82_11105 [Opitutaceae bacterium]|nr:hypothetical protein [Opitutaceae bacterium]
MTALAIAVIGLAAFATLSAFGYQVWLRPGVCAHFGEEFASRRDLEPARRRRSFEWRCGYVLLCLYGSVAAGTVRLILAERWPGLSGYFLFAQIAAVVVAGLFLLAARSRWMQPFED